MCQSNFQPIVASVLLSPCRCLFCSAVVTGVVSDRAILEGGGQEMLGQQASRTQRQPCTCLLGKELRQHTSGVGWVGVVSGQSVGGDYGLRVDGQVISDVVVKG